MKKIAGVVAASLMAALALSGCSKKAEKSDSKLKIGIIQLIEHPALDNACRGFIDALAEAGYVDGQNIKIDMHNAQGDQGNCVTISNKPTFILTQSEDGVKGSGRSIEEYSMYEEMCKCKELFTKFGGHPMAAGLSLPQENVRLFRKRINECAALTDEQLVPKIHIDVPMPVDYASMGLVEELSVLAPFGKDNPRPVFADRNLRISRMWVVGKNNNVLRLSMISAHGTPVSAIYFGDIEDFFEYIRQQFGEQSLENAKRGRFNDIVLSIVYSPKINRFRENESLQFEIQYYK